MRKEIIGRIDWDLWWMILLRALVEKPTTMKRRTDPKMHWNYP